MFSDSQLKQKAEGYYDNVVNQDMCGQAESPCRPTPSLRDEAQKRSNHHSEEASKAASAANFFHKHPEFEEFIRLARSGAIQL